MALRTPDPDDVALAALHALDGATRDVDPATEAGALAFAETVSALAEAASSPPVLGLRGRLLASAFAERAPGASIDDGGADTPAVAFLRTVRELDRLLAALDDADWGEDAHPAIGSVRDVVAHLLAVDHLVLGLLPDPPTLAGRTRPPPPPGAPERPMAPGGRGQVGTGQVGTGQVGTGGLTTGVVGTGEADRRRARHVEWARPVVRATAGLPTPVLRRRWRETAEVLANAARGARGAVRLDLHGLQVSVDGGMVLRTLELWAHLDDIARATGRRRPRLDARRLRAMSAVLAESLPIAVALAGHGDVRGRVRLVLTGPGGGTYDVALGGAGEEDPACTVTVDVVDLCRLAAARTAPDRIEVRVDGAEPVAAAMLASVSTFAMD